MESVSTIKKVVWNTLGFASLGMAYIGVVTPGIPFSIFLVGAAYCFAKVNPKMHAWLYNHKYFGPFLTNWNEKRVFPFNGKIAMILVMDSSLIIMWYTTQNLKAVAWTAATMFLVAVWAWRFPSTVEEYNRRKEAGEKIGWFK
jgi:uncharacterized membrane protein YbaN (DUF454 family)